MMNTNIYRDIAERTGGNIYIGVVGPVRTGKSTFIKKFMETLVLPNIPDRFDRERARDEMPQSAAGKTVMTAEPKFIPDEAVGITLADNARLNVRMIDCVGYIVPDALGHIENGGPRMVHTPWQEEPMPFTEAAETGTRKVITDHSTVGIVVTTDGTVGEIPRANYEEAESLASQIRIGSLSLKLEEMRSEVVGAQLGEEAISSSLKAAAIGLVIVMIFMIVQYLVPGVVAAFALAIYTTLVIATLYLFEITLTLPGIAGIILSIGMAVDANVIIFARIREEIADGKSVATAIETGFARARSAILDGNITTLIAAAVLGLRGSGTVKGFASTLAIGIILSMFTCMVVTKVLMHAVYAIGVRDAKFYGKAKERKPFDFVGKTGIFIAISCAIIVCGCVGVGMHKSSDGTILNYSLEFKGGTSTAVVMDKQYSIKEIDKEIVPLVEKITGDGNVQAQAVEGTKQIIIKTRTLSLEERTKLEKTMTKNFGVDKKDITSESISSTVSNEMKTDAIVAVVIATICMLLYIWFRFKDVRFAGSAVIALSHDVIMVFICYVLAWISVGNTFIACMLTIIGYSINNTIVIFDRIRDALKKHHAQTKAAYKEIVNKSIAQTMSRSVNTSITTFVMVLVLYIMGVTSIREFALPLMVGLLAGTYSSICLASEIWYLLRTKGMKKE